MKSTRQERAGATSATIIHSLALIVGCSGLLALTALASDPAWWSSRGAVVAPEVVTNDGVVTTNYVPNDYMAVTQGQLKQFTARAVDEMNTNLPGGAGTNLNAMVSNWASDYATNGYNATNIEPSDYAAMNVGQLKYIGNKVWSQLVAGGYTNAVPSWLALNTNTDNIAANLGQLKSVFNFDLSTMSGAPAAVTGLTATSAPDEIDLSWTLPGTNTATSLVIEQSTDGGTTWTTIATLDSTTTSYAATGLDSGTSFQYQVMATNGSGSTSSGSTSAQAPQPPLPLAPANLTGTLGFADGPYGFDEAVTMNLAWPAATNATSYVIDREDVTTGSWTPAYATGTTTIYTDTNYCLSAYSYLIPGAAHGYHYQVRAVNSTGTSTPSNEYPQTRYAVIDLGTGFGGSTINNNGYVLGAGVWYQGTITPLNPAYDGDAFLVYALGESGGVLGYEWNSPVDTGETPDWADIWAAGSSTPTALPYVDVLPTISNDQGDLINNGYGPGAGELLYNSTTLGFQPAGLSNEMTTGTTTKSYVVGIDWSSYPYHTVWWDSSRSGTDSTVLSDQIFWPSAINAATALVTGTDGSSVLKPAPQIVGFHYLWEMNPATGTFAPPQNLVDLVPAGSGWSGFVAGETSIYDSGGAVFSQCINDGGAIVGQSIYTGTATATGSHGVMLIPVEPTTPTLYMFSGHDSDQVNLTTVNCPGWTYQWKLKDSGSGTAQGSFENYGTTTWSTTGTTATVTFRPGVSGTGNIAGDTRAQSPGKNTIQLWANGQLIWEKPLEVLQILPRSSWGALAATTSGLEGISDIEHLTVHHSSREAFGTAEIQRIQQEHMGLLNNIAHPYFYLNPHPVWADIAYHFILDPSNDSDPDTVILYEGRQLEGLGLSGGIYTKGADVLRKNTIAGIAICMLGNYETGPSASWMKGNETFSETRRKKLEMVLTALSFRYQTPATLTATYPPPAVTSPPISWHQQIASQAPVQETTACPGNTAISTMTTTQTNVIYDLK